MTNTTNQERLKFLNRQESKFSKSDTLGLFTVCTFGLHLITFIILILLYGAYSNLSNKQTPTLVQLRDGQSVPVFEKQPYYRSNEVLKHFVSDKMSSFMNASNTLIPTTIEEVENPKEDPGVTVGNSGEKITTTASQALHALSLDYRQEFKEELSKLTPQSAFDGKVQRVLVPRFIMPPVDITDKKCQPKCWKVGLVAELQISGQNNTQAKPIEFNREIFVRAVEVPERPKPMSGMAADIYQARNAGLEIYKIRELNQENL